MREFSIEGGLRKQIDKLVKKDKVMYSAIMNKIEEILNISDINHYKNLRAPLQEFKRVHIKGSFVLLFKYDPVNDTIIFYDLDHHDSAYAH